MGVKGECLCPPDSCWNSGTQISRALLITPTEMYLTAPSVIVLGGGAFGRKRERAR